MNASNFETYLRPTYFLDFDSPLFQVKMNDFDRRGIDKTEVAISLFYYVRDTIPINEFVNFFVRENNRASIVLESGKGNCTGKAGLLCALARRYGIPARLNFVNIFNHRLRDSLASLMQGREILFHGRTELFLNDCWIIATPGFDTETCSRLNVPVVEFDGKRDALLPPTGLDGLPAFDYTYNHGSRDDFPFEEICEAFERRYFAPSS